MPNNKNIGPQAPGYAAPQKSQGTDPGNRSTWSHATSAHNGDTDITEAAQRKAEELGVDLATVQGTGAEGRITVDDVIKAQA